MGIAVMKKKIFFWCAGGLFLALTGLMIFDMSRMDIESLILCSTKEGGIRIPSKLCEYYMLNYRMNKRDIEELSKGAGLEYILNGENSKKYEIAEIFILNGLDVNGINHYSDRDVTPLHAAVIYNDLERVKFLIRHGADMHIKSEGYGMTAIELAKELHGENGKENRSEIIQVLSDADNT